jgi:predicted deacetylase
VAATLDFMSACVRTTVLSLHDVHPGSRARCAQILGELAALGVDRCSLLVVPDFHRTGSFLNDRAFCEWIVEQGRRGHEIVAHGYHHLRARRSQETLFQRLVTQVYTADEGEFFDLSQAAARALLLRLRNEFAEAGLAPAGFIAPAWLLSAGAEAALRELDWEYTTRLGRVVDLRSGEQIDAQSLVWSVRSGWRRRTSLCWNALLERWLEPNPLLRISIHPVDVQHIDVWRQIRAVASRALTTRRAATYLQWIAQRRSAREGRETATPAFRGTPTSVS